MIASGASVTVLTEARWTPLHAASYGGHADVVRQLLTEGADPYPAIANGGWTALHMAALHGHTLVVDVCHPTLSASCVAVPSHAPDPSACAAKCKSRLHLMHACTGCCHCMMCFITFRSWQVLLAGNGTANGAACGAAVAANGYTPLHCAAKGGHAGAVSSLLAAPGVQPNAVDRDNKTALHRRAF